MITGILCALVVFSPPVDVVYFVMGTEKDVRQHYLEYGKTCSSAPVHFELYCKGKKSFYWVSPANPARLFNRTCTNTPDGAEYILKGEDK